MARMDKDTYSKRMESDMRQFGGDVTNWSDTHSQISDEAGPLLRKWKDLNQRFSAFEEVPEEQLDAYIQGIDKDYSELKSEFDRIRSKYDIRH